MQSQIRIYTLGRLAIERNGQILENFLSSKTALLFVYLAMHPGEHPRENLASLLWSETNDEQSLKNLRTVLSSLRQQLDDVLDVSRQSLGIRSDVTVWVDALEMEAANVDGFTLPGTLEPLKHLQELAALYKGDFLAPVRVRDAADLDDWITSIRYRLQHIYSQLLYAIVEQARDHAKYGLALQYAHQLVAIDPLWEPAQRQLIALLATNDHLSDALQQYDQLVRLLDTELGASPDPETTRLYQQIKAGSNPARGRAARQTIHAPNMLFVEPADDVELAQRMLNSPQCRLLTVYGISGIGKTALTLQIAFHRQHLYRDSAHFIALAEASSAGILPVLIARSLGIELASNTDAETAQDAVVDYLSVREALLVLDNYEQLLPDTAFIERLLDEAPHVQLMIASQNPLNLYREWLLPLRGLRVPDATSDQPESYESVKLFDLTARKVNPRFDVSDVLPDVTKICRLVDGLPLGIILAAGWTQFLPISRIVEKMTEGLEFDLLYQRSLPERHQSIELMLEYTWNTLDAPQQFALISLSVFEGSFDLDTASQLCGVELDVLIALMQKSLVLKFDETYRMHQLVRRYAGRKLFYSPEKEALSKRYLAYYTEFLNLAQRRHGHIHDYLLIIETEFTKLWNFGWMPTSFQPRYILTMSRYLIVYLEVSHNINKSEIIALLEPFQNLYGPEWDRSWLGLVHIQLARLHHQLDQQEASSRHLLTAFQHQCATEAWADHCSAYNLFASTHTELERDLLSADDLPTASEYDILLSVYFNIAFLNLDMQDHEAADLLFAQIFDHTSQAAQRAALLGARGALAAKRNNHSDAYDLFATALAHIRDRGQPMLELMLVGSLVRLAGRLLRPDALRQHLMHALSLAVQNQSESALSNLLAFCAALREDARNGALSESAEAAIRSLDAKTQSDLHIAAYIRS